MVNNLFRFWSRPWIVLSLAWMVCGIHSLHAAPINHGDFIGSTVDFLDVIETANFPINVEPKFGTPTVIGNTLDFDPTGFSTTSIGGVPSLMDVQLNLIMMSHINHAITEIQIDELGDFTLGGSGSAVTQVNYALSLASVKVLAIDGVNLIAPITLTGLSVSGSKNLAANPGTGLWSLSANLDVNAALMDQGESFDLGATKISIALDNTLTALSEASSLAFVAKKDASGVVITVITTVPEPTGFMVCCLSLFGVVAQRRRRT